MSARFLVGMGLLLGAAWLALPVAAADWPMWRYDAGRGASSPQELPAQLHMQWERRLPAPVPAWPLQEDDKDKLQFDASYEPVVMGNTLFVPSMTADCLLAFDTETGAERWRFYCDGPVRFAPAAWQGKVYVVADDGYLYCLNAADGTLRWKFRGGPSDRKVLGNERLISTWAARGGPAIRDGIVYFTAGIWPFMGTFIHALDAETGRVVWTNGGSGSDYLPQQHGGAVSFAGVAPQGYLVAMEEVLLVPGGRTVPAGYDRRSGAFRYFDVSNRIYGKDAGAYGVSATKQWYFNGGAMYHLATGAPFRRIAASVMTDTAILGIDDGSLTAYAKETVMRKVEVVDRQGEKSMQDRAVLPELWTAPAGEITALHLRAGSRLYGSGKDGLIAAIDLPRGNAPAKVAWTGRVEGQVWTMLAADGKLFVVTLEGAIYCFGGARVEPVRQAFTPAAPPRDAWNAKAADLLKRTGVTGGYALVLGAGTGRLAEELARQSALHLVVVDPDPAKVAALRRRYDDAGLYGRRIAVLQGDPLAIAFPPYLAELIVSEDLVAAGVAAGERFFAHLFRSLRPYGGMAALPVSLREQRVFAAWVDAAKLPNARVGRAGEYATLTRVGALPEAADWTHQYADAGNTSFSRDTRVKGPLGILWFGGSTNDKVLPRHGHGPVPQVVDGRLFIQGPDTMTARDIYTGRTLWERELPDIGKPYDNTAHQPGANALGSNYVSLPDAIYVAYGEKCLRLDPATGRTVAEFQAPTAPGAKTLLTWGSLTVQDDVLLAMAAPLIFDDQRIGLFNWNATASRYLVAFHRRTGKELWRREAEYGFRHNAVALGGGKVFCIDRLSEAVLAQHRRLGDETPAAPKLLALDLRSGKEVWRAEGAFGTWLAYSADHGVLVQAGRASSDMLRDEPNNRMAAYRGADGSLLWDEAHSYQGPLVLQGERIISSGRGGRAFHLLTGAVEMRTHPLTGIELPWTHSRTYGCGTVTANENFLFFRSGAAGYYDLRQDGGTGNFGGFKAGCTNNMIPAGGLLNIPEYTRTCTCSYQLQTSLALVHMPEVEVWTWNNYAADLSRGRVRQVGLNFGAPGDRKADDGLLWLDAPSVGGPSPDLPVTITGEEVTWFRHHQTRIEGPGLSWVAASGLRGAATITVPINPTGVTAEGRKADGTLQFALPDEPKEARYTVRLHFCEPDDVRPGARRFNTALQGREVLANFDIAAEAGGPRRPLVKEFAGVVIGDVLRIDLAPAAGSSLPPVLSGVEVRLAERVMEFPVGAAFTLPQEDGRLAADAEGRFLAQLALTNTQADGALSLVVDVSSASLPPVRRNVRVPAGETLALAYALPASVLAGNEEITVLVDAGPTRKGISTFTLDYRIAKKLARPVTIDGDLADWEGHPHLTFTSEAHLFPLTARAKWAGEEDLSARLYLGWDAEYLYLAADVRDNVHANVQATGNLWNGDALQFAFFHPNQEFYSLGAALLAGGTATVQWGGAPGVWEEGACVVTRDEAARRTRYEMRIPLARVPLHPVYGTIMRFNAVLFDDDDGKGQKYWYQWSPGLAGGGTPDLFNAFILME